jgi:hypothetical protein
MYHLICVHPFGEYKKGDRITDVNEVERLMADRDHHFVRVAVSAEERAAIAAASAERD